MAKYDSIPTRSSLLGKIKNPEDTEAWKEFCEAYGGLVRRLALKASLTEDEADDVVQEVFISVTRNIGGFVYEPSKCSFKHWLSQMVRWRIQDQLQKRLPVDATPLAQGSAEDAAEGPMNPCGSESQFDAAWESEWKQHLIDAAAARVKKQVSAKQFQIFFLHVLKEIPTSEVVHRLKVSRTQVYLAKLRVGRLFQEALRASPE